MHPTAWIWWHYHENKIHFKTFCWRINVSFENASGNNNTLHVSNVNDESRHNIPAEVSELSVPETNFDHTLITVLRAASNIRYADNNELRLVNLGPNAFFSNYKLTTCSGRYLEVISHAIFVSVLYKLITSAKDTDDLYIGFDQDPGRGQRKLTNNKNIKGRHHVRIILKNCFCICGLQSKNYLWITI